MPQIYTLVTPDPPYLVAELVGLPPQSSKKCVELPLKCCNLHSFRGAAPDLAGGDSIHLRPPSVLPHTDFIKFSCGMPLVQQPWTPLGELVLTPDP